MFNDEKAQFARSLVQDIDGDFVAHNQKAMLAGTLTKSDEAYYTKAFKTIEKANQALYDLIKMLEEK